MESSGAFAETVVFLDHFEDLADPRQRGKVVYPLDEVLLPCLLAVLAGADSIVDIARFGDKKRDLLRRFRPFSDGTPPHDQLGTILAILDARMFQQCFVGHCQSNWLGPTLLGPCYLGLDTKLLVRLVLTKQGAARNGENSPY